MRCFILGLALAAFTSAVQPPQSYLEAMRLQQAGDCAGAIAHYRQFLEQQPNHPGGRSNLGACLAALGRYSEAITEYKGALETVDHPGIRRNLALAYYKSGRLEEAIDELEMLRVANPGDPDLALLLADCHFRLGQETEVIAVLDPLAAQHSDNLGLAYLLGTALIRQGQVERGQVLVDRILQRGDSAAAHLMLGEARLRSGEMEPAEAEFAKAVELDPALAGAWSQLGLAPILVI